MMRWNSVPVSPVFAGGLSFQSAGVSAARMSARSAPGVFTLSGANSVMSIGPAHSSRCLISSQLGLLLSP